MTIREGDIMAYTTQQAVDTLNGYLGITEEDKISIDNTKNRGFIVELATGERAIIFVYPLVHKQDNTKNYFDTRDSGAYERGIAWKYALDHGMKYFCFGVNDQVEKYSNYIFSLECDETKIEEISGTKDGARNGPGNQIIIPNDYVPSEPFERIKNKLGIFISAVNKDKIWDYLALYDNRPYLNKDTINIELEQEENPEERNKRLFRQWMKMHDNEDIFGHELFGMHIKEKNDALSEENPHVCIGWSKLGDLSNVDSKERLSELYEANYDKNSRGQGQDVGQIWRFIHDMKVGDYVIFAENSVFHIGRIMSDYCYDQVERESQNSDYRSNRRVKWLKKNISRSVLSANLHNSLKTAMSIWTLNDYKSAVLDLLRGTYVKDSDIEMASEYIEPVYNTNLPVKYERNRIIFGAPGTGKSFGLKTNCEDLMKETSGTYERVTFHPDYSYSQFVGAYKPVMGEDGNSIQYDFVPGPFMRVYVDAIKSGRELPKAHLLLLEEINRAKVAAVFGDIFQLLDRDDEGVSEYEIQASEDIRRYLAKELGGVPDNYKKIKIPNNMFIWATMNSADQGVFPMDTAFKRRWNFEYVGINESEEKIKGIGKIVLSGDSEPVEWNTLRKAINEKMASPEFRINEDKLMGPFFLSKKIIASDEHGMIVDPAKFIDAFKSKVIMYLYEDAVKQARHRFFDGCESSKYSSVCDAFDEKGLAIFGTNFKDMFYNKQRTDE